MEQKQSSRDIASAYILDKIRTGELRPGDKLTNERALSVQLGISRVPLREAISILSAYGILEARQGGGTFVGRYRPELIGNLLRTYSLFNRYLEGQAAEARIILEADAAGLAAKKRTDEDLNRMNRALEQYESAVFAYNGEAEALAGITRLDEHVHREIVRASHHDYIIQMIETLRFITADQDESGQEPAVENNSLKKSAMLHRAVVQAVQAGDAELAGHRMKAHILAY